MDKFLDLPPSLGNLVNQPLQEDVHHTACAVHIVTNPVAGADKREVRPKAGSSGDVVIRSIAPLRQPKNECGDLPHVLLFKKAKNSNSKYLDETNSFSSKF